MRISDCSSDVCSSDLPDGGGILARLPYVGDFDQFEIGLVHGGLEFAITFPVAISFLDHDAALEQQAFQYRLDVESLVIGVAHAYCDVFKVAEKRHLDAFLTSSHEDLRGATGQRSSGRA